MTGWFSFENGTATAGDLLARDVVCQWLDRGGYTYDIALAAPFTGGVDLHSADPATYSHVFVVCGPFERGSLERILLSKFWRCRMVGLNLSLRVPLDQWNPFDFLLERDSSDAVHPDFVFAARQTFTPVVGVCLVEAYPGGATDVTDAAIHRLVASYPAATVNIDTRLDTNTTGFRNPAEIESVLARLDVVITTRLHGMVLALKNGVPAIAIDPEPGGAKVRRQAEMIGWPVIFDAGHLVDAALAKALTYCLTPEAREKARRCGERAAAMVRTLGDALLEALKDGTSIEDHYGRRLATAPAFVDWDADEITRLPAPEVSSSSPLNRRYRLHRMRRLFRRAQ